MIFLSASIPYQERHQKYIDTSDVIAIRDAVRALATVVIPKSHLVWGGHPAISPLVHYVLKRMQSNFKQHLTLYQSNWFKNSMPDVNSFFENVIITPEGKDLVSSLSIMRNRMIRNHDYVAGIFIGGMEGVEEEFLLFRECHPNAILLPLASTGGAAKIVYEQYMNNTNSNLVKDYAYMSLFNSLLKNHL